MSVNISNGFGRILGNESFADVFAYGAIEVRTGPAPATADDAATGTLLGRVTVGGGAWSAGSPGNGLLFQHTGGKFVTKDPAQRWFFQGIATGTAGWCRLVGNAPDDGLLSYIAPRMDGNVGIVASPIDTQLFLLSKDITDATSLEILQWYYAIQPTGV